MATSLLARFTPSLMQPEMLEAMFVQREDLAHRIVDQVRDNVLSSAKNHNLLIGPRGIGKSHLVSLIHHRIAGMEDLRDRALMAWLREEEWGVTSFLDLLLRILRALNERYPDLIPDDRLSAIQQASRRSAEQESEKLLQELLTRKVLVLIVENLDDMFNGLGTEGQKKLRAYLQDNQNCAILATAQSLFKGVSLHSSPFYGFFRIQHLAPLEFDDAVKLIANIATWLQDSELAAFIKTPVGRARLRAVHHLAGGNHRVYVIFAEFLTRDSLDELVSPFLRMLDDLTPYYQARMAWLSPYQRKIVEYLCEERGALPVKEIAQGCFISPQSASSQLKILRDMGYVESTTNKRESFYELREPLMRLCIELKKNRGGPIRLLVDFLRSWHSRAELQTRLANLQQDKLIEREYLSYVISEYEEGKRDLRVDACLEAYRKYADNGDYQRALEVADELVAIRGDSEDLVRQGAYLLNLGRCEEALVAVDKIIELDSKNIMGWRLRAGTLGVLARYKEALVAADKIIELFPKYLDGWLIRAMALASLDRYEEALVAADKVIELDPKNIDGWLFRARALRILDRYEEALVAAGKVIELDPKNMTGWQLRATALLFLARHEEALVAADKVIELDPKNIVGWEFRARALLKLDRHEETLVAADKVIELDPKKITGWRVRTTALLFLARHEEMLVALDKAIDLDPKDLTGWQLRATLLLFLARYEEALVAAGKVIELDPKNIDGWRRRADALAKLHRFEEVVACYDRVIAMGEESSSLVIDRSEALIAVNRWDEAISTLELALSRLASSPANTDYDAAGIVESLFQCTRDLGLLRERVRVLIELHYKYERTASLGPAIVESIELLTAPTIASATRRSWFEIWQSLVGDKAEFQIPIRLLKAAVEYTESKDERVLLELPSEERRLLMPLLGIEDKPQHPSA